MALRWRHAPKRVLRPSKRHLRRHPAQSRPGDDPAAAWSLGPSPTGRAAPSQFARHRLFRSTLSSAAKLPETSFTIFFDFNRHRELVLGPARPFEKAFFATSVDQRQHGQQRGDRKRRYELIFIVEDSRPRAAWVVGLAADMARHHRHRAELAHGAGHCTAVTP